MSLSRAQTEDAYANHRRLHEQRLWPELAQLFADAGRYRDPIFGTIVGQPAIRTFFHTSMKDLDDWTFPIDWVAVDQGRAVTRWRTVLPGRRRDGRPFEFVGTSFITFGDDGKIVEQEDSYDRITAVRVTLEARSPWLEHIGRAAKAGSGPLLQMTKLLAGIRIE